MNKELAETIIEAITIHGFEGELRENYSGRFMYDITTCGVIANCTMGEMAAAIISNAELFNPPGFIIENIRSDQMGLNSIYY